MTRAGLRLALSACLCALAPAPQEAPLEAGTNAWHVDVLDPGVSIVCAGYDGTVTARKLADGAELWRRSLGEAFPFDLRAADLDGDGRREVLVAASDGSAHGFSHDGRPLFVHRTPAPLWQICALRLERETVVVAGGVERKLHLLDAKGALRRTLEAPHLIRVLGAGDLDGDGQAELVCASHGGMLTIHRGAKLTADRPLRMPTERGRKSMFRPYALDVADLDGDGTAEILMGSSFYNLGVVRAMGDQGKSRFEVSVRPDDDGRSKGIGHTRPVACDVTPNPGREVVVLDADTLTILGADGKQLAQARSPIPFSDLKVLAEGPGRAEILLGSTPNGDDRLYRLKLDAGWEGRFQSMSWTGRAAKVTANLEKLYEQVRAYRGEVPKDRPVTWHSIAGGSPDSEKRLRSLFGTVRRYEQEFPYPSQKFCLRIQIPRPADEIVRLLKICEEEKIPFLLTVGHSREVLVGVDTVVRVFEACPTTCIGVQASEHDVGEFPGLYEQYYRPLLDACKKHRRKALLIEKGAWWVAVPAQSRFKALADGTYAGVLVASVEDSNSRTPELNLMGRLGLRLAGAAEISGRSVQDELCFSRAWEWEVIGSGHPFLRRQAVQALLGASMFEYSLGGRDREGGFSLAGREGERTLIHLLGKGLLVPPAPEEMAGISTVALRMKEPDKGFLADADALGVDDEFRIDAAERAAPLSGIASNWAMTPTPPGCVGRYLLGCRRSGLNFVPVPRYGFPAIVPEWVPPEKLKFASAHPATDGRKVLLDGKSMNGEEAKPALESLFAQAAAKLPVIVEGEVFWQSQWIGPGRLRVTLIDPGFVDPADRRAVVRFQGGEPAEATDLLNGERLSPDGRSLSIVVPAGTLRIVEVRLSR